MRQLLFVLLACLVSGPIAAEPITYQGQLQQSGQLVTGNLDMSFRLYNSQSAGDQIGVDQDISAVALSDGLFQVELDFGSDAFDGSPRYLEIDVAGTTLVPRQKITAAPSAQIALGVAAGAVGSTQIAVGAVGNQQLAPGAVGAAQADSAQIQLRIAGSCQPGTGLVGVNLDGSIDCAVLPAAPARVVWVATGGDNTFPSLSAALASITDNSAATPYVIKIAPGTYTETGPVAMKDFVDIEGSGERVTRLTCACGSSTAPGGFITAGNITTEIRYLTITNTGGNTHSSAIATSAVTGQRVSLLHLTVNASGATVGGFNIGVRNDNSSPAMNHVSANTTGGNRSSGVANFSSSPLMHNIIANSRNGNDNFAVWNVSSSPSMNRVIATASGGSNLNSGVFNEGESSPSMENLTMIAGNGNSSYGMRNEGTSSPSIRGSSIRGQSGAILSTGAAVRIADSLIQGSVSGGGVFTCVGAYNQNFVALNTSCQ